MVLNDQAVGSVRDDSQFLDSVSFVDAMEESLCKGDKDVVEMNLDTLARLIADLASRKKELDVLHQRAWAIQTQHNSESSDTPDLSQGRYIPQDRS